MAEFTLPQMSKVQKGKRFAAKPGAKKVRSFKVYRWDPDVGGNPRVDTYEVDVTGMAMVLDVLLKIKNEIDPTDRKSTRLNSSHMSISYAVFCLKKKIK